MFICGNKRGGGQRKGTLGFHADWVSNGLVDGAHCTPGRWIVDAHDCGVREAPNFFKFVKAPVGLAELEGGAEGGEASAEGAHNTAQWAALRAARRES